MNCAQADDPTNAATVQAIGRERIALDGRAHRDLSDLQPLPSAPSPVSVAARSAGSFTGGPSPATRQSSDLIGRPHRGRPCEGLAPDEVGPVIVPVDAVSAMAALITSEAAPSRAYRDRE